jgi:hypothetical protein
VPGTQIHVAAAKKNEIIVAWIDGNRQIVSTLTTLSLV